MSVHHVLNHLWREPKWCCSIAYLLKNLLWHTSQINITFCILVELFTITRGFGTQRVFFRYIVNLLLHLQYFLFLISSTLFLFCKVHRTHFTLSLRYFFFQDVIFQISILFCASQKSKQRVSDLLRVNTLITKIIREVIIKIINILIKSLSLTFCRQHLNLFEVFSSTTKFLL